MERFGGGLGRVEEHAHVGTIDVVAGVGGALAACAALLLRERRKRNPTLSEQRPSSMLVARASLASLGQLVQYPFCCGDPEVLAKEGAVAATRLGPECKGEHALLRCYEGACGGWLLLCASLLPACPVRVAGSAAATAERALLRLALAHPSLAAAIDAALGSAARARGEGVDTLLADQTADEGLVTALAEVFKSSGMSATEWVARLRAVGVDAVELASISAIRSTHTRHAPECDVRYAAPTFQFLRFDDHPLGQVGCPPRCTRSPARLQSTAAR